MVHLFLFQSQSCGGAWLSLTDGRSLSVCRQVAWAPNMSVGDVKKLVDLKTAGIDCARVDIVRNCWPREVAAAAPLADTVLVEAELLVEAEVADIHNGYNPEAVYLIVRPTLCCASAATTAAAETAFAAAYVAASATDSAAASAATTNTEATTNTAASAATTNTEASVQAPATHAQTDANSASTGVALDLDLETRVLRAVASVANDQHDILPETRSLLLEAPGYFVHGRISSRTVGAVLKIASVAANLGFDLPLWSTVISRARALPDCNVLSTAVGSLVRRLFHLHVSHTFASPSDIELLGQLGCSIVNEFCGLALDANTDFRAHTAKLLCSQIFHVTDAAFASACGGIAAFVDRTCSSPDLRSALTDVLALWNKCLQEGIRKGKVKHPHFVAARAAGLLPAIAKLVERIDEKDYKAGKGNGAVQAAAALCQSLDDAELFEFCNQFPCLTERMRASSDAIAARCDEFAARAERLKIASRRTELAAWERNVAAAQDKWHRLYALVRGVASNSDEEGAGAQSQKGEGEGEGEGEAGFSAQSQKGKGEGEGEAGTDAQAQKGEGEAGTDDEDRDDDDHDDHDEYDGTFAQNGADAVANRRYDSFDAEMECRALCAVADAVAYLSLNSPAPVPARIATQLQQAMREYRAGCITEHAVSAVMNQMQVMTQLQQRAGTGIALVDWLRVLQYAYSVGHKAALHCALHQLVRRVAFETTTQLVGTAFASQDDVEALQALLEKILLDFTVDHNVQTRASQVLCSRSLFGTQAAFARASGAVVPFVLRLIAVKQFDSCYFAFTNLVRHVTNVGSCRAALAAGWLTAAIEYVEGARNGSHTFDCAMLAAAHMMHVADDGHLAVVCAKHPTLLRKLQAADNNRIKDLVDFPVAAQIVAKVIARCTALVKTAQAAREEEERRENAELEDLKRKSKQLEAKMGLMASLVTVTSGF